jgi:hypothetical protein
MCADVQLTTTGDTNGCKVPIGQTLPKGTCIEWRYITTDDKLFMAKIRTRENPRGSWVFVPRSANDTRPEELPNILTRGRAKCSSYWRPT